MGVEAILVENDFVLSVSLSMGSGNSELRLPDLHGPSPTEPPHCSCRVFNAQPKGSSASLRKTIFWEAGLPLV